LKHRAIIFRGAVEMMAKRRNKKGFLIVEATIVLPIFIIGVLTLGCLIPMMAVKERVMNFYVDAASQVAISAYVSNKNLILGELNGRVAGGIAAKAYLNAGVKHGCLGDGVQEPTDLNLRKFRYLYADNRIEGLISGEFAYTYNIPFPLLFYGDPSLADFLVFRGYVGTSIENDPMSYEEIACGDDGETVVIFPRYGKRYHSRECRMVSVYPVEVVLTKSLMRSYDSCKICGSDDLTFGSIVYCFTTDGRVYHKGNCPTVDKYVLVISRTKAEARGYMPCALCR
jgi:competence protein ComGC